MSVCTVIGSGIETFTCVMVWPRISVTSFFNAVGVELTKLHAVMKRAGVDGKTATFEDAEAFIVAALQFAHRDPVRTEIVNGAMVQRPQKQPEAGH